MECERHWQGMFIGPFHPTLAAWLTCACRIEDMRSPIAALLKCLRNCSHVRIGSRTRPEI